MDEVSKTGSALGGLITLYSNGTFGMPQWLYLLGGVAIALLVVVPAAMIARRVNRRSR